MVSVSRPSLFCSSALKASVTRSTPNACTHCFSSDSKGSLIRLFLHTIDVRLYELIKRSTGGKTKGRHFRLASGVPVEFYPDSFLCPDERIPQDAVVRVNPDGGSNL